MLRLITAALFPTPAPPAPAPAAQVSSPAPSAATTQAASPAAARAAHASSPATAHSSSPATALACLARHYALTPDGDGARLPDGTRLPFAASAARSADERLESPVLADMLAQPYRPGPIRPVTTPDEDPGRARVEALFRATYPARDLTRIVFMGHRVEVHARAAPAFARVAARLERALAADATLRPFVATLGGTLAIRRIAGTDRASAHSWGIAIDLDPARGDYWRWQNGPWRNRVPQAIVDAFEAEGFIWGGRWYHYDTMHFEYRPEIVDPSCFTAAAPPPPPAPARATAPSPATSTQTTRGP